VYEDNDDADNSNVNVSNSGDDADNGSVDVAGGDNVREWKGRRVL
jgi:hypothetical protein